MNAVQNPIQQNDSWFWFGYVVLLIQVFAFLIKYLYKEKQVPSAAEIVHIIGQTEHQTNVFRYVFQMRAEWSSVSGFLQLPSQSSYTAPRYEIS